MTFEQEHTEEHEQVQKQIENERTQQELDLAIARIQNKQIQRALDDIIESLNQEISYQDENIEEEVIDDHESQQSPSIEEELASDESMIEERSDQQHSLDQSVDTWELTSYQDKNAEEQAINEQEAQQSFLEEPQTSHDSVIEKHLEKGSPKQEPNFTIEQPDQASQTHTTEEGESSLGITIEKETDHLNSIEVLHKSFSNQSEPNLQKRNDKQITYYQGSLKTESLIQEERECIDKGFIDKTFNFASLTQVPLQDQIEELNELPEMGKKATDPYKSQSIKTKILKSKIRDELLYEEEILLKKTVESGNKALETGCIKDIHRFMESWNNVVDSGIELTISMINNYNSIKIKHNVNLYVIQKKDGKMHIRDYNDLNIITNPWFTGHRPVYPFRYKEWFIFTEKLEGKPAFIKVWIDGDRSGSKELYLVQNCHLNGKPAWNVRGIKKGPWKTKYSLIKSGIFEEVNIGGRKNPLKMKIIKELEKRYSYPNNWKGQKRWIDKVYRLKYDKNLINEHLEIRYSELVEPTSFRSRYPGKIFLRNFYDKHGLINYYTDGVIDTELIHSGELSPNFCIVFIDESYALKNIINELKTNITYTSWDRWIDQLYKKKPLYSFAQSIQRGRIASIIKSDIMYDISHAERILGRGNFLTRRSHKFWDETLENGFSGLAKALLKDPTIRERISGFSNYSTDLSRIHLKPKVNVESRWAHTTTNHNLASVPDIIAKYKEDNRNIASETVQNKLARKIGRKSGEINAEHYFLDYLKTIGNYDSIRQPLNLQFEFIPFGKTLGGLTDIAKKNNVIIISYWGKLDPVFARFGEIISAIHRIGKFGRRIIRKNTYMKELYQYLEYGDSALGFKRYVDVSTEDLINDIFEVAKKANGELSFYQGAFLEFLRKYNDK